MVKLNDLSKEEFEALKKLASGPYLMLTKKMADRLKELGLAEEKLGGTGISEAGKRLLLPLVKAARDRRAGKR